MSATATLVPTFTTTVQTYPDNTHYNTDDLALQPLVTRPPRLRASVSVPAHLDDLGTLDAYATRVEQHSRTVTTTHAGSSSLDPSPQRRAHAVRRNTTTTTNYTTTTTSTTVTPTSRTFVKRMVATRTFSQTRITRVNEARTPEFEVADNNVDGNGAPGADESIPLLSPTPLRFPKVPLSSRPTSAASDGYNRGILRRIFIDRVGTPSQHLLRPTFPPTSLGTYSPPPHKPLSWWEYLWLCVNQAISMGLSTVFLIGVVAWAFAAEALYAIPKFLSFERDPKYTWDDAKHWRKADRKVSKEPQDYARKVGMDIENQTVETEDGFLLRMHRVIDPEARPRADGRGGFPVLILHGLFQSSGSFITSEDRSLAFWLAKQKGYQVYLGNTRGIFDMGHRSYSRSDPRFWDWTIRDLAMYDLPAMVEHVCRETGYEKIAFIGHSQGNGLTFISLSLGMVPNLGKKLSVFIALAPAVYAGPLTHGFPFTTLNRLEWHTWKRFFGVLDFIPLMRYAYDYCPAQIFATMGYIMFAFLFSWTDTNWLKRRKTKMFRFTPTPVSSASIFWWCGKGGFADRKCTLDDTLERWYDERFPPLSIYYGGRDYLVLAEPLLERLKTKETDVRVHKVTKLDKSEHCDFYWAAEAVEWAYDSFVDDIESTRPRYPEEEPGVEEVLE